MTDTLDIRAKAVIDRLVEVDVAWRDDALETACSGDMALRQRVESLLRSMDKDDEFLSNPSAGLSGAIERALPADCWIGPYKLLELIGEGGFGSVYLAEQSEPVRRAVALKIIKAGMDTRQVIARFEAERQALAMMDHPNIARVLDAGATGSGRPYFVMELVRGDSITKYCDQERLPLHRRLELFGDICLAVQHAHQKGVIHRDLKPSNVLVTVADGRPIPKVIDFGIAKATSSRLTDRTMFTDLHQLIGTPEYMSPEQAEGSGVDIDTRSDVYSLGVLLFELLTGSTPFDHQRLRSASLAEMQRILRDEEPPRPSARLAALTDSSGRFRASSPPGRFGAAPGSSVMEIAGRRQTELSPLARALRGDLDWIVLKCLEKDRSRRYQTAGALAEDVARHLSNEPVLAIPHSAIYRLRKLVQRHRGIVAVGLLLAVVLISAAVAMSLLRVQAVRERDRALAKEQLAVREAEKARRVAEFQAKMLREIDVEAMGRGIRDVFRARVRSTIENQEVGEYPHRRKPTEMELNEELASFDEQVRRAQPADVARQVVDAYVLQPAGEILEKEFADQPLVKADIMTAIGSAYHSLGNFEKAEPHLRGALDLRRRELGPEHEQVAASLMSLGVLLKEKGDNAAAEQLLGDSLAMYRTLLGHEHPSVANCLDHLGRLLSDRGDQAGAEPLLREALTMRIRLLGDEHLDVALSLNNLALLLTAKGDYAGAEPLYRESLTMYRKLAGDQHTDVAGILSNLAKLLGERSDYAQAEPLFREALAIRRKSHGDEHPSVAMGLNNLGWLLNANGDYARAEPVFREALELQRKLLGDEHPEVATTLNNLASLLHDKGDYAAAEPCYRESLAIYRKVLGAENPYVSLGLHNLARLMQDRGAHAEAVALFSEALAMRRKLLGDEHWKTLNTASELGGLLRVVGRPTEAITILAPLEPMVRRTFTGSNTLRLGRFLTHLGRARVSTGDFDIAETNLTEALAIVKEARGARDQDYRNILSGLAELYDAWHTATPEVGYDDKAAEWRSRLAERQASDPAARP